jgi:predicted phage-related endonuclease
MNKDERAEWLERRNGGLGGSDANTLMSGKDEWIERLWKEKRGEIEPQNLDGVLHVRMGQATEAFNVQWFYEQTGKIVTDQQKECISSVFPFMRCTLDGIVNE